MKKAFTILELIFVIVIIGILAGIAIPKLFPVIDTAKIKKAQSQVSAIRAAISNAYSKNIISGENVCPNLEKNTTDNLLFENILTYPIHKDATDVKWDLISDDANKTVYSLKVGKLSTTFTYDKNTSQNCPFNCNPSDELCKKIEQRQ